MNFYLHQKLLEKTGSITIIGLGYVGLPLALAFAKKFKVVGFDINEERVALLKQNIDPSREIPSSHFSNKSITFTADIEEIKSSILYIITVPTPIDVYNLPDLRYLKQASEMVGNCLKKNDYVIFESTVYPGCTEEDCLPLLLKYSGLKMNEDFKVGYSPERINPGDLNHTLERTVKVVSGSDSLALEQIGKIYSEIITAGLYYAPSIKVAEAAKIIENTQRDLNIAFMNELSLIFDKLNINTYEVLEAAGTKWNFQPFKPGLVGGHCIGVDPYYLTYKAKMAGYSPNVILSGRYVNDEIGGHIAKKTIQLLIKEGKSIQKSKVLILGATFKENVHDIRTSRVVDILKELSNFGILTEVYDPYASSDEFFLLYGFTLSSSIGNNYDAIIVAVAHQEFVVMEEVYFLEISTAAPILIDVKGIYRKKIKKMIYWSL